KKTHHLQILFLEDNGFYLSFFNLPSLIFIYSFPTRYNISAEFRKTLAKILTEEVFLVIQQRFSILLSLTSSTKSATLSLSLTLS
ncbi:hypothetical protein KKC52_12725, partial [bacterium]|nr:hypothetical protein [bacterium]